MKNTIKRHLISFVVTFLAFFLLLLYPAIEAGDWQISAMAAAIFSAARAAMKVAWESVIVPLLNLAIEWAKKNRS